MSSAEGRLLVVANERADAVTVLERLAAAQERELRETQALLARLKGGMAVVVPQPGQEPVSAEYAELGPIEAIRRYMTEVGTPQTTRELADALLARGLRTRSRNFTASIHATLKNAPGDFKRNERGQWELLALPSQHRVHKGVGR